MQNGVYRGLKTVRHGGALAGYRAYMYRFPEQHFSILILGNVSSVNIDKLPFEIANIMLEKELNPLPAMKKNDISHQAEVEKKFETKNLNQYSGIYYSEELGVNYQFIIKENDLWYRINNCEATKLQPVSKDTFKIEGYLEMKFEKDDKNRIEGFQLNTENVKHINFKIVNRNL